jgi:hypothetical protein
MIVIPETLYEKILKINIMKTLVSFEFILINKIK